jgi:fumarylacetoacetate (FAA) hydrolase family protein
MSDVEVAQSLTLPVNGTFLGRMQLPHRPYPSIATVRDGVIYDITSREGPTVSEICELEDPAAYVRSQIGFPIATLKDISANSLELRRDCERPYLLSPVDLQAVKAAGVTFAISLLERLIEEHARGSADKAGSIRADILGTIGPDLSRLKPGSVEAKELKSKLIARGMWSQYLEVGIGPDAEIFTKCQPMSAVGYGADIGLHPDSVWNNPEPELAVVVNSRSRIVGATLGNDVNLRDIEGRSALLLGRAKDNNGSASLGPFIRLIDNSFSSEDISAAEVDVSVHGVDGFALNGTSSMAQISRSPEDLVTAAMGRHHQYPDGMVLYLGTMFVPSDDRGEPGKGFTHHDRDVVRISSEELGTLVNRVRRCDECQPWVYGVRQLMKDLAAFGLI